MNDLISVIIPAYNAETRIKYALESITAQDYEELEIIVVDDASTDSTRDIAQEVLNSSGREFTIITHTHNRGVSAARNTGLAGARGKYIVFMDSDDVLKADFAGKLHGIIGDCDISCCGLVDRFTDGQPDKNKLHSPGNNEIYEGEKLLLMDKRPPFFCSLYRKSFLDRNNLRFHEGCTAGEDTEFQVKAFCMAGKVIFIDEYLYIYVHHENMGSVRDNNTGMKKLLRYEHNTFAQKRTAEYLIAHAGTEELKRLAEDILLPQSVLRMFSLYAMRKDRAGYDALLNDKALTDILSRTQNFHVMTGKSELFFKAFTVLHLPNLYYRLRS